MIKQLSLLQQCSLLNKKMAQQLAGYEIAATDEKERIEWGFGITTKAWFSIQQTIERYEFSDQQEEISFFKMLKPKFIGLIDFFTLLYKLALFQPDDNAERKQYWQHELEICKTFLLKYNDFRRYCEQGKTDMDHIYFVRQNNQQPIIFGINENNTLITSYSYLLARVISITIYQRYVKMKICNNLSLQRTSVNEQLINICKFGETTTIV